MAFFVHIIKRTQMNKRDVEIGVAFYTVLALGKNSFIEKSTPTSEPYTEQLSENYSSIFVNVKQETDGWVQDTEMSLSDAGIIPNTYNKHESFLSEKAAKHHLKFLLKLASVQDHP